MTTPDATALYTAHRDRLYALCYAILHDRSDAEDAVQETFARVAPRAGQLDGDPAGFLTVVARNVCRDELRRRSRRHTELDFTTGKVERAPDAAAIDRDLLRFLWQRLGAGEQTLFAYAFHGLSLGEIAARAGISVDSVAQRMSRARRRARQLISVPAVLLGSLVRGRAMGRLLGRLAHLRGAGPGILYLRSDQAQQVIWPLLLGVLAGTGAGPAAAGAVAVRPPSVTVSPPVAAAAASQTAIPTLRLAPAVAAQAAKAASTHVAAVPATTGGVPPDAHAYFTSFTPSPGYQKDHTIFGASSTVCSPACATLWRSQDAGHSWRPLSYQVFGTFQVLLPATYPADPTVYVLSTTSGLQRSDDGGMTFRPVVPVAQALAAVDPTSPPGDTRILLAAQTATGQSLLLYSERDDSVRPLSSLPTGTLRVYSFLTTPGAAAVYVDAAQLSGAEMYACSGTQPCGTLGGAAAVIAPVMSPTFAVDRTYFAAQATSVLVATLDGDTRTIDLGGRTPLAILPAADYATSHRLDIIASTQRSTGQTVVSALRSVLSGAAAVAATTVNDLMDFASMTRLPDGRLLVGVTSAPDSSLRCSTDDGVTWAPTC